MALDRDGMVTEICDAVGKTLTASSVSGATLQDRVAVYLNWAQKRIARFYSFQELNTLNTTAALVADVKRYPITTGDNALGLTRFKDFHSIRLDDTENSRKLERWHYRKFDKHFPRPENYSTGRPNIYIRWGNYIEVFRVPNAAYDLKIRHSQWAQDFTSGTQYTDFENKDQLLVTAGVFETYFALEEYSDAGLWYPRFLGQLKDAVVAEGDVDWEPEAEPHVTNVLYASGEPWLDPYAGSDSPLSGYSE